MQIDPQSVWTDVQAIKELSPLVHNVTNYVVMENTANGLLAIGASPVMAHAVNEAEEMAGIANSLVLNIGTLSPSWIEGMMLALKAANNKRIPVVLDPVGVGATSYRRESARSLLNHGRIAAIRGNASEVATLSGLKVQSRGVDSPLGSETFSDWAKVLATSNRCVVWMSGATDVITDGRLTLLIHNGHPLMSRVTGMGCMATALTGAFLAVNRNAMQGCAHAAVVMGVAGEIAAKACLGPGSFKVQWIDTLYALSLDQLKEFMRVEVL